MNHFNNFQDYLAFKRGRVEPLKVRVVSPEEILGHKPEEIPETKVGEDNETEVKGSDPVPSDDKLPSKGKRRKKSDKAVSDDAGDDL